MSIAAPRPAHLIAVSPTHAHRDATSAGTPDVSNSPSPVFRGILFAGLFSLPFWGGLALVVALLVH